MIAHHRGGGNCQIESGNAKISYGFYGNPDSSKFVRRTLQIVSYEQPEQQDLSYSDFLMLDDSSFIEGWKRTLYEWLYLSLPEPIQRLMGGGIAIVRKIKRVGSRAIFGDRA